MTLQRQRSMTGSAVSVALGVLLFSLCVLKTAQGAIETGSTLVYSSRASGKHAHEGNRVLREVNHYELHDFSSLLKSAKRRLLASAEEADANKQVVLPLRILGRSLEIVLERDTSLFLPGYKHQYLDEHGKEVNSEGPLNCLFRASIKDLSARNHGAFALCEDDKLRGTVFSDERFDFTIEPLSMKEAKAKGKGRSLQDEEDIDEGDDADDDVIHAVYSHDDLKTNPAKMTQSVRRPPREPFLPGSLTGVDTTSSAIATPFTDSKLKYVGLTQVNDLAFYRKHGAQTQIKAAQLIATTSAYYRMIPASAIYRIQLDLAQMVTFIVRDPYTVPRKANGDLDDGTLLGVFGAWLQTTTIETDAAHLFSGIPFSSGAAGWGYIGTVCDKANRFSVGETDGTMSDASASVVAAHEIGHVLGAEHDDVTVTGWGTNCNSAPGIMGRRLQGDSRFSTCTLEWWRLQFTGSDYNSNGNPACLERADYTVATGSTSRCGDGLVDGNEECDCPNGDCSANPCCDGATCRLKAGAQCSAHQGCCDPATCSARPSGFTCRAAVGECDVAETCTGSSFTCPGDARVAVGTPCSRTNNGRTISGGTCSCDGCITHNDLCTQRSSRYVGACSWLTQGDDACDEIWCDAGGSGCSGFGDSTPTGMKCGAGMACMNKRCVAANTVTCGAGTVVSPPTGSGANTANPTRQPTPAVTANPTRQPTSAITANPTRQPTSAITANPTRQPTRTPTRPLTSPPVVATRTPTQFPTKRRRRRRGLSEDDEPLFLVNEVSA